MTCERLENIPLQITNMLYQMKKIKSPINFAAMLNEPRHLYAEMHLPDCKLSEVAQHFSISIFLSM